MFAIIKTLHVRNPFQHFVDSFLFQRFRKKSTPPEKRASNSSTARHSNHKAIGGKRSVEGLNMTSAKDQGEKRSVEGLNMTSAKDPDEPADTQEDKSRSFENVGANFNKGVNGKEEGVGKSIIVLTDGVKDHGRSVEDGMKDAGRSVEDGMKDAGRNVQTGLVAVALGQLAMALVELHGQVA